MQKIRRGGGGGGRRGAGGGGEGGGRRGGSIKSNVRTEPARAQELCESRGGRPGLPSLISLRFPWT